MPRLRQTQIHSDSIENTGPVLERSTTTVRLVVSAMKSRTLTKIA